MFLSELSATSSSTTRFRNMLSYKILYNQHSIYLYNV